jgi:hypothetical protein
MLSAVWENRRGPGFLQLPPPRNPGRVEAHPYPSLNGTLAYSDFSEDSIKVEEQFETGEVHMHTLNRTSTQALRAALGVTRNIALPAARTSGPSRPRRHILVIRRWIPVICCGYRWRVHPNQCCNN